mgnify:CR=1 FL=1
MTIKNLSTFRIYILWYLLTRTALEISQALALIKCMERKLFAIDHLSIVLSCLCQASSNDSLGPNSGVDKDKEMKMPKMDSLPDPPLHLD